MLPLYLSVGVQKQCKRDLILHRYFGMRLDYGPGDMRSWFHWRRAAGRSLAYPIALENFRKSSRPLKNTAPAGSDDVRAFGVTDR
jgi:hypothetical protein